MTDYVILRSGERYKFNISVVSKAVESVTSTLLYKGACLYLPSPDGDTGKVLLAVSENGASREETDHFLGHLAGYLEAELLDSDGEPYFADSPETDMSFLESLPAPEAEYPMMRLFFSLEGENMGEDIPDKLADLFEEYGYEVNGEIDGFTVYIAANSYLDIFITRDMRITGEADCTFSGAGVYAEIVDIARRAASALDLSLSFVENPFTTYTQDDDFEKLRREFYITVKQQLAFAFNDDRDGLQAYYAWGTDSFETEYKPGTIVTALGRYDFDKLKDEIRKYGFSYMCDHRLLTRNTPSKCADTEYKEVLNLLWNTSVGGRDKTYTPVESDVLEHSFMMLEETYDADPFAMFPLEVYNRIAALLNKEPRSFTHIHEYDAHYEPGYMSGDVFYGFGHYLRRFRLSGRFSRDERIHGRDVTFFGENSDDFTLECEILYGIDADSIDSTLGEKFVKCDDSEIECFEVGGSSIVRYAECEPLKGKWHAEAEVVIKDEMYRFAAISSTYDKLRLLYDALRSSISVEDWYDEAIKEEIPDPHASGATFCTNGVNTGPSEYTVGFPYGIGIFDIPTAIRNGGIDDAELDEAAKYLMELFRKIMGGDEKSEQADETE